jgi:hypothetical protein
MTIAALVLSTVAAFAWPIVPFRYHAPGRTLGEQPRAFWDYAPASVAKDGMRRYTYEPVQFCNDNDEACFAAEAKRLAAEAKRKREHWRKASRA